MQNIGIEIKGEEDDRGLFLSLLLENMNKPIFETLSRDPEAMRAMIVQLAEEDVIDRKIAAQDYSFITDTEQFKQNPDVFFRAFKKKDEWKQPLDGLSDALENLTYLLDHPFTQGDRYLTHVKPILAIELGLWLTVNLTPEKLEQHVYDGIEELRKKYDTMYYLLVRAREGAFKKIGLPGGGLPELIHQTLEDVYKIMERDLVARVLYSEAENDEEGIKAVAETLANRMKRDENRPPENQIHTRFNERGPSGTTKAFDTIMKWMNEGGLPAMKYLEETGDVRDEDPPGWILPYDGYVKYILSNRYAGITGDDNMRALGRTDALTTTGKTKWERVYRIADELLANGTVIRLQKNWVEFRGKKLVRELDTGELEIYAEGENDQLKYVRTLPAGTWEEKSGNYFFNEGQ